MNTIEILKERFGYTLPIVLKDLRIGGITKVALRKELSRAVDKGIMVRKANGIYCFKEDISGIDRITFDKIVEVKFVKNDYGFPGLDVDVYGFYTGQTFLNTIGISQQVPAVAEIVTNNTSCNIVFSAANRKAILRKSKIKIDNTNSRVLQLIDMFNYLSVEEIRKNRKLINNYLANNINKADFNYYLRNCSASILKSWPWNCLKARW